jgi:outer membrane protein assembly factor BamB
LTDQPPAIAKNKVYVSGTNGTLYALRASSGKKVWSSGLGSGNAQVTSAPSVANGVVYADGGGNGENTTAYDAANGTLLWSSPDKHGTLFPPPIVANGILYFGSPGGTCSSICAYSSSGNRNR